MRYYLLLVDYIQLLCCVLESRQENNTLILIQCTCYCISSVAFERLFFYKPNGLVQCCTRAIEQPKQYNMNLNAYHQPTALLGFTAVITQIKQ